MSEMKLNCSFIGEKISKLRWMPDAQNSHSELFVTGSWGLSDVNSIQIWKFLQNQHHMIEDDLEQMIPTSIEKCSVPGDVYALETLDWEYFIAGTSKGSVILFYLNRNGEREILREKHTFNQIHTFEVKNDKMNDDGAACTGLSTPTDRTKVVSVGEDGCLNVLSITQQNVMRSIKTADSCSITCVSCISPAEVLIGNRMGFLKMFDIRSPDTDTATATFLTSCVDDKIPNAAAAIAYHPTQKHIIIVGTEEGSVTVWDLRQPHFPASYLSAHDTSITEVNFHQTDPTRLFTACEGGELFQWSHNSGAINNLSNIDCDQDDFNTMNPWLCGERTKHKINGTSLIGGLRKSINSFHAVGTQILASSDNEALYLIDNL